MSAQGGMSQTSVTRGWSLAAVVATVLLAAMASLSSRADDIVSELAETATIEYVVTQITPFFGGELAGIQVDDRIVGWTSRSLQRSEGATRRVAHPFELKLLERERHPSDPVTLIISRDGQTVMITPGAERWRTSASVVSPSFIHNAESRLFDAASDKTSEQLSSELSVMLEAELRDADPLIVSWLHYRLAVYFESNRQWRQAAGQHRLAIGVLDSQLHADVQAYLYSLLGGALLRDRNLDGAQQAYNQALAMERAIGGDRFGIADALRQLGDIARRRGDLPAARQHLEKAITHLRRIAPESMAVPATLNRLCRVLLSLGEYDAAQATAEEAVRRAELLEPAGVSAAGFVNTLGGVAFYRGDLAAAEAAFSRAAELKGRLEPGTSNHARTLANLAIVSDERGSYREAERAHLESLAIEQQNNPGSMTAAGILNNLGNTISSQHDYQRARTYFERALSIRRQQAPGTEDVVFSLSSLGNLMRTIGDLDAAEDYLREALTIQNRIAPDSRMYATVLQNLGAVAEDRGDVASAAELFTEALSILDGFAPDGIKAGESYLRLGEYALQSNDLDTASQNFAAACTIFLQRMPMTLSEARVHYGLARVSVARDELVSAQEHFEQAINALDAQFAKLGGTEESRSAYRERVKPIYDDFIDLLLRVGEPEKAFEVLERARARVLREQLENRDLKLSAGIPADLDARRRRAAYRYESARSNLRAAQDTESVATRQVEVDDALNALRTIRNELRSARGGSATPDDIPIRSYVEIRDALPTQTAVLSYHVTGTTVRVFAISSSGQLRVATLDRDPAALRTLIERYRLLLDAGRFDSAPSATMNDIAATLYLTLVAPVAEHLVDSRRVVIVPDGELRNLPFAALRLEPNATSEYFIERMPQLQAASVSLFIDTPKRSATADDLIAFGSPDYQHARRGGAPAPEATSRSADTLPELVWSGVEVERIADIVGDAVTTRLGADATERQVLADAQAAGILHLATHAILDLRNPLDSSLVFSVPEDITLASNDGYLHAWEIYQSLQTTAKLVVLSACETAVGKAFAGEGLMSLTRAFHFAGANSVMASLWRVDDRSTSDLMAGLYVYLDRGDSIEAALQRAQIDMIEGRRRESLRERLVRWWRGTGRDHSHPYHWAGFVLDGDRSSMLPTD